MYSFCFISEFCFSFHWLNREFFCFPLISNFEFRIDWTFQLKSNGWLECANKKRIIFNAVLQIILMLPYITFPVELTRFVSRCLYFIAPRTIKTSYSMVLLRLKMDQIYFTCTLNLFEFNRLKIRQACSYYHASCIGWIVGCVFLIYVEWDSWNLLGLEEKL